MSDKEDIIQNLITLSEYLDTMIDGLDKLDKTDDKATNRNLVNEVTFAMFNLVDRLVNTEADIYNYFHRRDRD